MVSIVEKSDYLNELRSNPTIGPIVNFILFGNELPSQIDGNKDASNISKVLYNSIQNDRQDLGIEAYKSISLREPLKTSDWIFDDFLVFACVCFITKFGVDQAWINKVLALRMTSTNIEVQEITKSYYDIIRGNLSSNTYQQIQLIYQHLINQTKTFTLSDESINQMLVHLWQKPFPYYSSDFLNILSLKAIELAFVSKGMLNPTELLNFQEFQKRFLKRIKMAASIIIYITIAALFIIFIYLSYRVTLAPEGSNWKLIGGIFSFFGLGIVGIWKAPKILIPKLSKVFGQFLGYQY